MTELCRGNIMTFNATALAETMLPDPIVMSRERFWRTAFYTGTSFC
jgi:hypothetical protein